MNATELRAKSEQELKQELTNLYREQFNLRMQRGVNPQAARSDLFGKVRRNIARIKTLLTEKNNNGVTS